MQATVSAFHTNFETEVVGGYVTLANPREEVKVTTSFINLILINL